MTNNLRQTSYSLLYVCVLSLFHSLIGSRLLPLPGRCKPNFQPTLLKTENFRGRFRQPLVDLRLEHLHHPLFEGVLVFFFFPSTSSRGKSPKCDPYKETFNIPICLCPVSSLSGNGCQTYPLIKPLTWAHPWFFFSPHPSHLSLALFLRFDQFSLWNLTDFHPLLTSLMVTCLLQAIITSHLYTVITSQTH